MQEGNPPPPPKSRPPLKTETTTIKKIQERKPDGTPGPIQRTVVKIKEVTPVKAPPPKTGA